MLLRIAAVVIILAGVLIIRSGVFESHVKINRPSSDVVMIGDASGDHARYSVGQNVSFTASSIGYDYKTFHVGEDLLSDMGARAVLSYTTPAVYAAAAARAKCGQCFGSVLSGYESSGQIGHALLIPRDDQVAAQMRKASIPLGQKFHVTGEELRLIDLTHDGHGMRVNLGGTGILLVASIELE